MERITAYANSATDGQPFDNIQNEVRSLMQEGWEPTDTFGVENDCDVYLIYTQKLGMV